MDSAGDGWFANRSMSGACSDARFCPVRSGQGHRAEMVCLLSGLIFMKTSSGANTKYFSAEILKYRDNGKG